MNAQQKPVYVQTELILHQLYQNHQPWLYQTLYRRLQNKAEAEDICQQVFVRLCEQPELVTDLKNARAWMAQVAGRFCIDHWRRSVYKQQAQEQLLHITEQEFPSAEQQVIFRQQLEDLNQHLLDLPARSSSIFVDACINNLSGQEIAKRHRVSLSTVRNHLRKTRQQLQSQAA